MRLVFVLFFLLSYYQVQAQDYIGPQQLFTKDGTFRVPKGDYRLRILVVGGGDAGQICKFKGCSGGSPGEAKVRVITVRGPRDIEVHVGKGALFNGWNAESSRFGQYVTAAGGKSQEDTVRDAYFDDRYFNIFKVKKVARVTDNSTIRENGGHGVSIFSFSLPCAGNASFDDDEAGSGGCGYGAGGGSLYSKYGRALMSHGADGVVYTELANTDCPSRTDLLFAFVNDPDTSNRFYENQLNFLLSVAKSFLTPISDTHIGLLTNEEQPIKISILENERKLITSSLEKELKNLLKGTKKFDSKHIIRMALAAEAQYNNHASSHKNISYSKVLVIVTKHHMLNDNSITKKVVVERLSKDGIRIIVVGIGKKHNMQKLEELIQNPSDVMVASKSADLRHFSELVADISCTDTLYPTSFPIITSTSSTTNKIINLDILYPTSPPTITSTTSMTAKTITLENKETTERSWADKSLEELKQELINYLNQSFENIDLYDKKSLQKVIDVGRHLIKENTRLKNVTKGSPGLQILDVLNRFGIVIASKMEKYVIDKIQSLSLVSFDNSVVLTSSSLDSAVFEGEKFPHKPSNGPLQESIYFHPSAFSGGKRSFKVVSMVYEAFDDLQQFESGNNALLTKRIISSVISPPIKTPLKTPIILTFKNSINIMEDSRSPSCVFWASNNNRDPPFGTWLERGCWLSPQTNKTHTVCLCNHLTSFAVLMQVKDVKVSAHHQKALTIITYFGCTISALGCALTVIVFILLQSLRSERILIHLNLAIALGVAQIVFSVGSLAQVNEYACFFVTILLYYLFMSVFTWMLVEGIHIYFMVIKVFEAERKRKGAYFGIGWGAPLVLTIATSVGYRDKLMAENFCWLSISSGAIWTFVGPALFIVLVNFIVLMMVLKVTANAYGNASLFKDIRAVFKAFLTLVPLLGTTWILGVLAINYDTLAFQYLFCLFGSLQGLFIFLLYCIGSSEVRRELKRKWNNWDAQRQISMSSQQKNKIQLDQSRQPKKGQKIQHDKNQTYDGEAMIKTKSAGSLTTAVYYKSKGSTATNHNVIYNV